MLTTHTHRNFLTDLLGLAICFGCIYFLWLANHPLFVPDEGRYSEIAREMLASGDYVTPRLDGVAFLDKPALYYWLQAAAMRLFGVNEWAIRFWPVCFGIGGTLAIYIAGRSCFDRRTGLLAALMLATSPLYFGAAHYANLDLEVATFISFSLYAILAGLHAPLATARRQGLFLLAFVFAGLAFLTKGLIGLAFPLLITGCFILLTHQWRILKELRWTLLCGALIFLAIVTPWYWQAQRANPEFLHFFFVTQQFTRFLSNASFNNQVPFWFYIPIVLLGLLPWTVFLPQALWRAWRSDSQNIFLLLWAGIVFVFFSIPHSKTIGYILPVLPPLVLLLSRHLALRFNHRIIIVCALFAIAVALTAAAAAKHINPKSLKPLALTIKSQLQPTDEIVTFYKYYQDVPLYLQHKVTIVADWQAADIAEHDNWLRELWYCMPFQDTSSWLISENTFWQRWQRNDHRLFVIMDKGRYADFMHKAGASVKHQGEYHGVVWVSNR